MLILLLPCAFTTFHINLIYVNIFILSLLD
nr:MAG TPA: hypothetical protein [Caudoviricetes sp.]